MPDLDGKTIVDAWEAARDQHPIDRALTLLAAGYPERSHDELAQLPIGARDRLLFELRERLFGGRLALQARCPGCGEVNEFEIGLRDVVHAPASGPFETEAGGVTIQFRLPTSVDLACALAIPDAGHARQTLAERCVITGPAPLDDATLEQLAAAVETADPQAEIQLGLTCAVCEQGWKPVLDIGELMFSEVTAAAHDLVAQVHALALAYKWAEADILAMTAARRRLYLQMVGHA
jgi:hypothetical protein